MGVNDDTNRRVATRLALGVLGLSVAVFTLGIVLGITRPGNLEPLDWYDITWGALIGLPFPIVGVVIARAAPRNPIGWLFLGGPVVAMAGVLGSELVNRWQIDAPAIIPYLADTTFYVGIGVMAVYFFLLFPSGRPHSRAGRVVGLIGALGIALTVVWSLGRPCVNWVLRFPDPTTSIPSCDVPLEPWFLRFVNPFGVAPPEGTWGMLGAVGGFGILLGLLGGVASLFFRYRRADVVERTQLRWLLAILAPLAVGFITLATTETVWGFESDNAFLVLQAGAMIGVPTAIAVAMTRHRLFEVDRIVNRTVVYGFLAVVLTALYAALSSLPTLILGSEQPPAWAVAVSTLAAAASFSPLRRRVQRLVDRRLYRSRYDAQAVSEGVGQRLRSVAVLDDITRVWASAATTTLNPEHTSIWISGR